MKKSIETAVINDKSRIAICLSTQSGCRYGCKFCATGKIGFNGIFLQVKYYGS